MNYNIPDSLIITVEFYALFWDLSLFVHWNLNIHNLDAFEECSDCRICYASNIINEYVYIKINKFLLGQSWKYVGYLFRK